MEMLRRETGLVAGDKPSIVIQKIIYYFGFPTENEKMMKKLGNYKNVQLRKNSIFTSCKEEYGLSDNGIDLLRRMLDTNPRTRITPFEALNHSYVSECINIRIPNYVPISPIVKLSGLGSYYPSVVSQEYIEIRHLYVNAYNTICRTFRRLDITELVLMLMYTDALSSNIIINISNDIELIIIAISQIIGCLSIDDPLDAQNYLDTFVSIGYNYKKCCDPLLKIKIHELIGIILHQLKFPLARCSYVTLGYYVKNISNTLYKLYLKFCEHIALKYCVYKYSNEDICVSILTKMKTYLCDNHIISEKLNTICEKINFQNTKTFEIVSTQEIQNFQINDVLFSLS
jgi:hypothetical protein